MLGVENQDGCHVGFEPHFSFERRLETRFPEAIVSLLSRAQASPGKRHNGLWGRGWFHLRSTLIRKRKSEPHSRKLAKFLAYGLILLDGIAF